jgi:hypothetical protein
MNALERSVGAGADRSDGDGDHRDLSHERGWRGPGNPTH